MSSSNEKIAVIGMAGRFPGAKNINEFWQNLLEGKDTIKHFKDEELQKYEYAFDTLVDNPNYVKARGILNDVEQFDADFFNMTPKEAAETDPQHRVWLETVWDVFENAGYDPYSYQGAIGVFAGSFINTYLLNNILRDPDTLEKYIRLRTSQSFQIMMGNDAAFIPTKTAYKFNLKGPAINVQTACSTSLVAIAQACQSLFSFESDMALAGGVCILVPQECGYIYQEGAIPSPDGVCRPFDAKANGTVFSNGVGIVLLKRLEDAIRDKDHIYALIRGWALNNDGNSKVSYSAPSVEGQTEVIKMAQSFANISPEDISYIEAHGTATHLGDPVEIKALKKAFSSTSRKHFCGIGSVKSNIGHTDAAAGVASFIKVCLSAYHRKIPATIHFKEPNKLLHLDNSPFYIQDKLMVCDEKEKLVMGVSSFGIGGTNAHVIVEEPPRSERKTKPRLQIPELMVLSAKNEKDLMKRKQNLIDFISENPDTHLSDIVFTLATGRNHMNFRSFIVADNNTKIDVADFTDGAIDNTLTKIVFMFPGQGAQYITMGRDLYLCNPFFRSILDKCFDVTQDLLLTDLRSIILYSDQTDKGEQILARTEYTQPSLFIIEYALAKLYESFGIKPDYLIGHSIGEYTAACLAGVFDLTTALKIVIKRGQLMQSMQPGSMMAVRANADSLNKLSNNLFVLAADNAPGFSTISFKTANTEKVRETLDKNDISYVPLNTSHAFHSESFDPIVDEFSKYVDTFEIKGPELPVVSCLTGNLLTKEEAISGSYWAKQLRYPVQFRKGLSLISRNQSNLFLEVGPNTHLHTLVIANKSVKNRKAIVASLGKPDKVDEYKKFLCSIGKIFNIGLKNNFSDLYPEAQRIALPGYPFQKNRHWFDFNLKETGQPTKLRLPEESNNQKKDIHENHKSVSVTVMANDIQTVVLEIWKTSLGTDNIDPDDDFFELGGHSLLALQIIAKINERLHKNISLNTFLEHSTINKLCLKLEAEETIMESEPILQDLSEYKNISLSANQKRIWVLSKIDRANPAYNIPFTYHFTGDLEVDIFCKSIDMLVNRHFILFSVFKDHNGKPYSEIIPQPVQVEISKFTQTPLEDRKEKILQYIGDETRKPFNLETGPLFKFYLIKQDDSNIFFHAIIHHIIFDGWSWTVFIHDLKEIYESLAKNQSPKLDSVKPNYDHYFTMIQKEQDDIDEKQLEKFWIEYLKGYYPKLSFPIDNINPIKPSGYGERETLIIPETTTKKLQKLSRNENVSLFASVVSAVGVLFQKYSGENDICIGIPVAYRPHSLLQNIAGFFINTIPLRLITENNIHFRALVQKTKKDLLQVIAHQRLSFDKIVNLVNPERNLSTNPLFQVAVTWINDATKPLQLGEITGNYITSEKGVSPFNITLYLWETDSCIKGEIEYNIDILKRDTILRLKSNLLSLLDRLVNNSERAIEFVPLSSNEEKRKVLSFSGEKVPYPKKKTIAELFEDQVIHYPEKSAVVFQGVSLSYQQLNAKANQLARTLRDMGVKSNTPVGLLVEKSMEMIIGILGILKAGGGYVPIDPEYPEQRINHMLADADCRFLLTQEEFMDTKVEGVTKVNLNSTSSYHKNKSNIEAVNSSSDLAYIMYTSGTTGKPKGSLIAQYSVIRLVRNTNYIELTSDDRILMTGAAVFDATTFEIWGALLNGGTLYIVDRLTLLDPETLGKELHRNEITILWLTSPLFTQLSEARTDIFGKLKYLLVGGDVLSASHINQVRKDNPDLKVINGYGPTENTTFSTTYLIEKDFDQNIPIGKPISNSTAYIFDEHMNYQPIGVIGELYVGGDGLSTGYLNRDDLNKSRFIENPHHPGERLYRTGDRARWLADGNIEFHGRIDNQIKIRGFRVEVEEIETVLSGIEGIIESVVKPIMIEKGDTRLVAFLHVTDSFNLDTRELISKVREKLPPYMVPYAFKQLKEFPKTINGKIDRNALTVDEQDIRPKDEQKKYTFTDTEKKIYSIWCETLKTENITATDNFFEVGGNSLMAITVFSAIQKEFKSTLSLRIFFDNPTIKELAERIDLEKLNIHVNKQTSIIDKNIIQGEI